MLLSSYGFPRRDCAQHRSKSLKFGAKSTHYVRREQIAAVPPDQLASSPFSILYRLVGCPPVDTISKSQRDAYLKQRDVTLLGGGMDESPQVYKPIEQVIAAQSDLVELLGKFTPRIVRMADEPGDV